MIETEKLGKILIAPLPSKLRSEFMWVGILTQSWADIQEEAYRYRGEAKQLTGDRWCKTILLELLSHLEILFRH